METLTFTNGQVFNGHILNLGERLWLYFNATTIYDVWPVVSNPELAATIKALRYGRETVVEGFTHLVSISEEPNQMVAVGLVKA